MKRTIECLKIKGFEYNSKVQSETYSAFYDKKGNEDDSIEITPAYNDSSIVIITYRHSCQDIRVMTFLCQGDSCWWKEPLEKFIEYYMPSEMKN